jgi:hypothetical protein
MSISVQDHDFLPNEHFGEKVKYRWCEFFDPFEGWLSVPTLVVDFRCAQMAILK